MTSARPEPDLDAEAEVDLGRYGRSLLQRWWLLLAGLVAGAVVGYLTTLGGTQFYRGQAIVYMGQPLGVSSTPVQALNTNPSSARTIVTSESVIERAASKSGMSVSRIRSGTSVTAVQGSLPKLGQTPLVQVTVKGPERAKVARAANVLANVLVAKLSPSSTEKIKNLSTLLHSDDAVITALNAALGKPGLSSTDKLLLQLRLQAVQADRTQTAQSLSLATNIEAPQIVTRAAAEKTSARNHRNSTAVGGLIGLILGGIAALLWEPLTRARRREP
jgi:capsular polysaccharide biosynthesis protein